MLSEDDLKYLADSARRADEILRLAVVEAVRAGMLRRDVHDLTGVARTTINRWIADSDGLRPEISTSSSEE
ncbi:helix-turn-helix domain-containing protein [Gordonia hankookensis]|uniref:Helix-turn-helix domain-containing protein n=1 Tax=Gordonia hankookensis TaxID=589403 RepID=A0ABR7WFJ3_9ACTN|nr:helix-turn-helix domain-containing protein [Gordonia hankookensis]